MYVIVLIRFTARTRRYWYSPASVTALAVSTAAAVGLAASCLGHGDEPWRKRDQERWIEERAEAGEQTTMRKHEMLRAMAGALYYYLRLPSPRNGSIGYWVASPCRSHLFNILRDGASPFYYVPSTVLHCYRDGKIRGETSTCCCCMIWIRTVIFEACVKIRLE